MIEEFFYKKCNKYLKYLPLNSSFHKEKIGFLRFRSDCKECRKVYKESRKDIVKSQKQEYYKLNKETIDNRNKQWRKENPYKSKEYTKEWRLKNLAARAQYKKEYYHRKKEDPIFFLKIVVRNRTQKILTAKGLRKSKTYSEYIGCSPEELKQHIEKQFKPGMSWNNYSHNGWHIDHIIPLSKANTEEEVFKLCHYSNLQPLWAEENYKKSNNE